ncbi:MAG TPA: DUF4231 domain-containing protein, partial [Bacteroidia bacterium]|nr:DUF4231 domain-containing protein [Bacteroidia bacterium]
ASIPFVSGIEFDATIKNITVGALGTLVAILTGMAGFLKFQEKWMEYRSASEELKQETMLYKTRCGSYKDAQNPFDLFVTTVENRIKSEHSNWRGINNDNN